MPDGEELTRPARDDTRLLALVADDDPEFRATLSATLSAFDPRTRVIEADTGVAARSVLLKRRPQLAFVNLQLPKLSGAEALAWAVARGVKPFTIVISAVALSKWIELAIELGAYEFLRKPFDPAEVTPMLEAHRRMTTPLRLLLADGSGPARQLVCKVLAESRFSFEVEESEDGRHTLNALRHAAYDVLLVDRNLPGIDGLELACQAGSVAPLTRLVLMTSGDATPTPQAVKQFGIAALLRKPFYLWDLELALHTAFGLRRPDLLNALPAHVEAESRRVRERLAEAKRIEREGTAAPVVPDKEAESVFYL